jgi:excisionase family DNA binding protein
MPPRAPTKQTQRAAVVRTSEVLDVEMTAQFLTVSADTVDDLLKRGGLPGQTVGRKVMTTRAAVLRWMESSSEEQALVRALWRGDRDTLHRALHSAQA